VRPEEKTRGEEKKRGKGKINNETPVFARARALLSPPEIVLVKITKGGKGMERKGKESGV
jgi:hypothetical protein